MLSLSSWAASLLLGFAMHTSATPAAASLHFFPGSLLYGPSVVLGVNSLNRNWYNNNTGLWGELWWNSGNAFTTLSEFLRIGALFALPIGTTEYLENTFKRAQLVDVQTTKFMNFDNGGMMESHYCINGAGACATKRDGSPAKRGFRNFLNEYYDDEGWWALALIRAYDATYNNKYLNAAVTIFEDMQTGLGGPCNGGIYRARSENMSMPSQTSSILALPRRSRAAYRRGMINSDNLVNDGLDGDCKNNGQPTWTYNQGVILGGLVELSRATGDRTHLTTASKIAKAAIAKLSNKNGILEEVGGCEFQPGRCGQDGQQFKGIFIPFILNNAKSIWKNDREPRSNKLGVAWAGPYFDASSATQSSALDALVAAITMA
ncbi:hypothetical protein BBAD15_g5368 [Beauveria bassiana D1-5]|uniref:Mannan endo-1,6-alpha-mannosidase n=1 Tax=Beauveria bassiana D1-5 TaxID=1245745 RepID=A0A0A2W8I6_BEABA|nr:hypothetical protein BBAD15_g5368 [Beauveria bassiana D1-5]